MKHDDLVISGAGVISPIGIGKKNFSEALFSSKQGYRLHQELTDCAEIKHRVGYVNNEDLVRGICPRRARKLDRFCLLSMQAFKEAYDDALLTPETGYSFGIMIGNSTGGWSFVEPQLNAIYSNEFDALSPYVATAWFPTAPQGELSIEHRISGSSKTFSAGFLSSSYAMEHAIDLIQADHLPGVFVGGVESSLSPLVYNAYVHKGLVSLNGSYLPYSNNSDSALLSEGSAFFVIEKFKNCIRRGSRPLVKTSPCFIGENLEKAIQICLNNTNKTSEEIDVILLDCKGIIDLDNKEMATLNSIFHSCESQFVATKQLYGAIIGADFALQVLVGVSILEEQAIPLKTGKKSIQNVLCYSIDEKMGTTGIVLLEKNSSVSLC